MLAVCARGAVKLLPGLRLCQDHQRDRQSHGQPRAAADHLPTADKAEALRAQPVDYRRQVVLYVVSTQQPGGVPNVDVQVKIESGASGDHRPDRTLDFVQVRLQTYLGGVSVSVPGGEPRFDSVEREQHFAASPELPIRRHIALRAALEGWSLRVWQVHPRPHVSWRRGARGTAVG